MKWNIINQQSHVILCPGRLQMSTGTIVSRQTLGVSPECLVSLSLCPSRFTVFKNFFTDRICFLNANMRDIFAHAEVLGIHCHIHVLRCVSVMIISVNVIE